MPSVLLNKDASNLQAWQSLLPAPVLTNDWLCVLQMILPPVHQLLYSIQQNSITGSDLLQLLQTQVRFSPSNQPVMNPSLAWQPQQHIVCPAGPVWHSRAAVLPHPPAMALQPGLVQATVSLVRCILCMLFACLPLQVAPSLPRSTNTNCCLPSCHCL